jgi:hypothetical protein
MITVPRLRGALEGFFMLYGHWPTRLYVEPEVLAGHYQFAFDGRYVGEDRELLVALSSRLQFLGRTGAAYLAEDEAGTQYNYGEEGFPDGFESGALLRAWLAGQA